MVYRLVRYRLNLFQMDPILLQGNYPPQVSYRLRGGTEQSLGLPTSVRFLVNQQDLTAANVEKSSPKLCTVTENHSISFVSSKPEATVFDNDSTEREPLVL